MSTFADGAALRSRGLDVEGEEHYGAVRQVCDEVIVPTGRNGHIQEGSGALGSGGLHPVVVTELKGERENMFINKANVTCVPLQLSSMCFELY